MTNDKSTTVQVLNRWFEVMAAQQTEMIKEMREDYELYFGDIQGTRTQFDQKQLAFISEQYDIPISTKINWAIIELITAFMTGGKPMPRLIATTSTTQDFATMYTQAFTAAWYESHMNRETALMIREGLTVGRGVLRIRPNDFYNESTFGVISEYVPFYKFFFDPHAQKEDLSDAEYMCIVDVMTKEKAEKKYDVTITEKDLSDNTPDSIWGIDTQGMLNNIVWPFSTPHNDDKTRYVYVREFFSKQQSNVYVSERGDVATKKPKPKDIPNPDKAALGEQIAQLQQQAQQQMQQAQVASQKVDQSQQLAGQPQASLRETIQVSAGSQRAWDTAREGMDELTAQITALKEEFAAMPETITVYDMTTITGEEVEVRSYFRKSEKLIKRWLLVGDKIVDSGLIPCDEYPIITFTFSQQVNATKVYGLTHYIKDMVFALNKFWSLLIYDMQTNAHRRVLADERSIADPTKAEKDWSQPNAWIYYKGNKDLPDGGRPYVTEPGQISPALEKILSMVMQLVEYIVGISALNQTQQPGAAPDTFGGIQTIQTFGTQRVRLYSRVLEDSMERLAYVFVCFLQSYMPKDKTIYYLDENGDQKELEVLQESEDIRFKVRVNVTAALPTQRAMAAQLLGVLGGQTKDPHLQQLLMQYMVDYMDMPESQKIREEIDTVKNLAAQLEQLQAQLQDLTTKNAQLEQQNWQKDLQADAVGKKAELDAATTIAKNDIQEGGESQAPTDDMQTIPDEEAPF